jgi:hypothetical protein
MLNETEFETLCRLLVKLYDNSKDNSIKRVAKSLFSLLTKNRFSTGDTIIEFEEKSIT